MKKIFVLSTWVVLSFSSLAWASEGNFSVSDTVQCLAHFERAEISFVNFDFNKLIFKKREDAEAAYRDCSKTKNADLILLAGIARTMTIMSCYGSIPPGGQEISQEEMELALLEYLSKDELKERYEADCLVDGVYVNSKLCQKIKELLD